MSIITISRGSYSHGREVAEKVAQRLGYSCISREVLIGASEEFNIPEIKLRQALHDAPSIFDRFTAGKERYITYIESTLLDHAQKDNIVYHGLAGHFILRGIKHILNVRILANLEDRVDLEMEREKISREAALKLMKKDDQERRQWSLKVFGVDTWDPSLYDLCLHLNKITVENAVDIICQTAGFDQFKTTPESQKAVEQLALAAKVKAKLVSVQPGATVQAQEGVVHVEAVADMTIEDAVSEEIKDAVLKIPGVKDVRIRFRSAGAVE
jgi:cytidylate kinase